MEDLSKWTVPQQEVIRHNAGNLLVSASAGSGKTSVLIEKIVRLIVSGNARLKNLLVVTFTNSASQEIKMRLKTAIEQSKNEKLLAELDDLSTSDILTFDAFCIKVVREFGYEIGMTSDFSVADESLSGFLKNQALDNVFAKHNKSFDESFMNLIETFFASRNEKDLKVNIIKLFNFLRSKSSDFSYRDKLDEIFCLNKDNETILFLNKYLLSLRDNFLAKVEDFLKTAIAFDDKKVVDVLQNSKALLEQFSPDFEKNFELLREGFKFSLPNRSEKDVVEIYQLKTEFMAEKSNFNKKVSEILTDDIKKLSIQKMNDDLSQTKSTLNKLFDVVCEFEEEYQRLKQNYQVLDFCDIETFANRILSNKNISESLQNRYDWIFIDEYQDTSLLQEDIVKKITTGDNLFMVGDLKQSIYRFRQAEPKIFLNKYNQFKDMKSNGSIIELKTNFRSEVDILEFSNFVFDHIYKETIDEFEYKGNADLEFGGNFQSDGEPKVNIIVLEKSEPLVETGDELKVERKNKEQNAGLQSAEVAVTSTHQTYSVKDAELVFEEESGIQKEAKVLASEIAKMIGKKYFDAKSGSFKEVTFGDIAVLSKSGKTVFPEVQKVLKSADIPITVGFEENLFECLDMQILFDILKTIENTKSDVSLVSSMSNIGGFSFDDLAKIRLECSDCKFFYEAIDKYKNHFDDEISKKINSFFEKIFKYRKQCAHKSISELILSIVSNENLDEYFAINDNQLDFEGHLNLLLSEIKSINEYSLSEFISYIEAFGSEFKIKNNLKDSENAVTLSTIHASKGLEYPVVFLIDSAKNLNAKSDTNKILMDNDWGIAMNSIDVSSRTEYNSLVSIAFKQKQKAENQKEAKRLLYVALTRPKNFLTIIGTLKTNDIKSQQTDFEIANSKSYLEWILGCFSADELKTFDTKSQYVKHLANSNIYLSKITDDKILSTSVKKPKQPEQLKIDKKNFFEILSQNFSKNNLAKKNSVSQIMSEEEHYNISNFDYLKTDRDGDEDFLSVGTAYHKYMELLDFSCDENYLKSQMSSLKTSGKISEEMSHLVDEVGIISAIKQISDLINAEDTILKEQQFLTYMPADMLVKTNEKSKILVQGVADLLVIKDAEIYLIDYKTSRLKDEVEFSKKYKTQLDIYAKSIESFYQKPVTKKMIYSFYLNKLVII